MAMPAAPSVADSVGACEIFGFAGFGTFRKLLGNQLVERVMLGGIGSGTSRTTCGTVGNPRLRQRIKPNVSSIARTFTSASRTSAFATSESARSASFDSNVLPERIAVKIAAKRLKR